MRIKVKADKCSGCRLCRQICTIEHFDEINPRKAALRIQAKFPSPGKFKPWVCTQCGKCAEACPEDAINEKDSIYLIDEDKCTHCMLCIEACPFDAITKCEEENFAIRCDLCMDLEVPACVSSCHTEALAVEEGEAEA